MKRLWLFSALLMGLSACAASAAQQNAILEPGPAAPLPDLGPAPELTNQTWLNAPRPLRLADLRGKVVAIDMWTFS
jgi:hypothetical protein